MTSGYDCLHKKRFNTVDGRCTVSLPKPKHIKLPYSTHRSKIDIGTKPSILWPRNGIARSLHYSVGHRLPFSLILRNPPDTVLVILLSSFAASRGVNIHNFTHVSPLHSINIYLLWVVTSLTGYLLDNYRWLSLIQLTLSHDQLWAASLIGRNAVTWRWALSYVHRFTVTPFDITMSDIWYCNVKRGNVTWRSLNANVTYIVRCLCLRFAWFSIQTAGLAFGGTGLCSYRARGVGGSRAEHLTVESYTIIHYSLSPYSHTYCHTYYYWYSITHSLFHSRLKSFLVCKSSLPQPFLFAHSGFTIWISQTVYFTSEHIRLFTF